jgi:hypothetical protein
VTGLTAAELAERQRTSVHRMEAVLVDSQKLGLVEVDPGGYWRLTDAASRRLGVAVSSLRYEHEPEGDTQ